MKPRVDPVSGSPALRVRVERAGEVVAEGVFTDRFTVGRGEEAALRVEDGLVSREHVEVVFERGRWRVRDLGSTNGAFVDGEAIEETAVDEWAEVELGLGGPIVFLDVEPEGSASGAKSPSAGAGAGPGAPMPDHPSATHIFNHYFGEGAGPAGARTMMVRDAYQRVHRSHRRRVWVIVGTAVVLLAGAIGYALVERQRNDAMEATALAFLTTMREQDRQLAQLRLDLAVQADSTFGDLLAEAEDRLRRGISADDFARSGGTAGGGSRLAAGTTGAVRRRVIDQAVLASRIVEAAALRRAADEQYDGFVQETGAYRRASPEELEILRVARLFNESEFALPEGFTAEIMTEVGRWKQRNLTGTVRRAEQRGYVPIVVRTMQRYGLPPEFFYLALVESYYDEELAVGCPTRWGIAKGIWQFIPTTGEAYGLARGPLADQRLYDPDDERFQFEKATDAAAQYLLKIYTDLSQASGLLAMASYNWGEGNVVGRANRLPTLPFDSVRTLLADLPQDTQHRSYWRFYSEYRGLIPQQTKDYVVRIFAAAVIGRNPRLFGFDFDNPLAPYLTDPPAEGPPLVTGALSPTPRPLHDC